MIDNNKYIKIIDFGEAKIVDNYETASNLSHFQSTKRNNNVSSQSVSSDGTSSFFGKLNYGKNKK